MLTSRYKLLNLFRIKCYGACIRPYPSLTTSFLILRDDNIVDLWPWALLENHRVQVPLCGGGPKKKL